MSSAVSNIHIRTVSPNDAAALLAIYAPYVQETAITFEYDVPSTEEFARRITHTLEKYPYLVAEKDHTILGYAYAGPFHERAAYDWAVETSIYVDQNLKHSGIGGLLHDALEKALKKVEGVGEVSVVITLKNTSEKIIAADSDYSESVIQESDSAGGVRSTTQQSGSTSNIYYDTQEGSEPYVTKENMPEVEGIVIVAKGGGDGNVCADITAAAEALLGVPAHKIKVLKMN